MHEILLTAGDLASPLKSGALESLHDVAALFQGSRRMHTAGISPLPGNTVCARSEESALMAMTNSALFFIQKFLNEARL